MEFNAPEMHERARGLSAAYPIALCSTDLSLGTPGSLDQARLTSLTDLVTITDPVWISERIGFSRIGHLDLGNSTSVPPNANSIHIIASHAVEIRERLGRPLLLENVSTQLRIPGDLGETDFLNRLCEASGCGLSLNLSALSANARIHGFDPMEWLHGIEPSHIRQLKLVQNGNHDQTEPCEDVPELARWVFTHVPLAGAIIAYEGAAPPVTVLEADLRRLHELTDAASCRWDPAGRV